MAFVIGHMKFIFITVISLTALIVLPWLLSWPIRLFTKIVIAIRLKRYDPERITCKGCGYRGDKRSNNKTVELKFTRTTGPEKAAIRCTCFRCGAEEFIPLRRLAREWVTELPIEELKKSLL